jgi:LemA protein
MTGVWIGLGVLGLVLMLGLAGSYNRFVTQRNLIRNSWSDIDTELRRRYDLIPNVVETVKGYAVHEREIFEEVARARQAALAAQGQPGTQAQAENTLVHAVRGLLAVVESYPDLKASQSFLALQRELANTEDRIQAARRYYNANVRDYNRRLQAFPSMLVASMFGFKPAEYFEIDEAVRLAGAPAVGFGREPGAAGPGAGTQPAAQ